MRQNPLNHIWNGRYEPFCELSSSNSLFWHSSGLVAFHRLSEKTVVLSCLPVLGAGSEKLEAPHNFHSGIKRGSRGQTCCSHPCDSKTGSPSVKRTLLAHQPEHSNFHYSEHKS